ncbi:MAG TPA: alpha/beta fold hydrolase [Vicinamibacterales bacterium]|nr:alpha/beta fold hydrolase [Vicinamibacterales bacterium]
MLPPAPPMHYATTSDGVRIAYVSVGDGPPLVFASNIFGDLARYRGGGFPHVREVTDRLAHLGWRVIRYDHRGMGASDRDVTDLSFDARVRDLDAVVRALSLERFALGGVDVGTATAVAYAVEHPAMVSHLVLLSPWPSGARHLQLPALRAALSAEASGEHESRLFANILGSVSSGFKDPELVRQGTDFFLQATSLQAFSAFNTASARIDIRHLLPRVTAPTLVTHEPAFPFGSFELCQEVAAAIPRAEFLIVNENSIAGREHNENVAAIDRFLRAGTATSSVSATTTATHAPPYADALTPREIEVLQQVASGATNKEIAAHLGVAVSTVERHLVNLYTKIGARGRADAVA